MTGQGLALALYRCQQCDTLHERLPEVCHSCLGTDFVRECVPGQGTLASWTTIRKPAVAFRGHGAFDIAVVDLTAGLRVTGRIESHEHQQVGDRVVLAHTIDVQGQTINVFEACPLVDD